MTDQVYQQISEVEAGDVRARADGTVDDLDLEITVAHPRDEALSFAVTLKNLADSTWAGISEGDPARVSLGWLETDVVPVVHGTIDSAAPQAVGRDTNYNISGRDQTGRQFDRRLSRSWDSRTPDEIARNIARRLTIAPGQIDRVPTQIDGYYQIDKQRPIRYWLDQLVNEAEKRSDTQWQWFGRAGRFHFKRKDTPTQSVVLLSDTTPRNLIEIGEATGKSEKTEGGQEVEFKAILTPSIVRDGIVAVDTDDFRGEYRVVEYEHQSDTLDGTHITTGSLVSVDAQYRSRFDEPRTDASGGGTARIR